ncbi:MAG TPA: hypothetical protein VGO58_08415 [Chitinophagaceae bacterium]|nr:hypothetical protein [Chitinophagaceae bacterium]
MKINKECSDTCRSYITENRDRPEAHTVLRKVDGLCRDCIAELHMRVDPTYGDPADAVDLKGVIYRSWVHNDDVYFSRMTPEVVVSCEQKVRGIKVAYEQALNGNFDLADDIRTLLNGQLGRVAAAVDFINDCKKEMATYSMA